MRNKVVTVNGKDINVQERRIGELEQLVAELFPGSGGSLAKIDLAKLADKLDWDLFYGKVPLLFPQVTVEDVKQAYPSELEVLVEAFVDVHFFGLKRLMAPLLGLARTGLTPKP